MNKTPLYKAISIVILVAFISTSVKSPVYAQVASDSQIPWMPKPGVMIHLSPEFNPAQLKGVTIHVDNALMFDFIVQRGDKRLSEQQKQEEYKKLIKYFLASLAIPDDDQWVNLSPYEKNRIIKDDFGKTEMGRDLLAQDYILKQITASLIYPEDSLGKKFWNKVYSQAQQQFGTTNIPVNTFNKVWIVPDDALIYEKGNTAYIVKNHLKVMLEEDYLSLEKHTGITNAQPVQGKDVNKIGSQVVREIVLPALEQEVNEGKNFAPLRQVYSGVILAAWYKRALRQSLLGKIYDDKAKVKGVDTNPKSNEEIYRQYLRAYKKGVFNYIKEDVDRLTNETIPRKYFSGGTVALPRKYMGADGIPNVPVTHNPAIGDDAMATGAENGEDDVKAVTEEQPAARVMSDEEYDYRYGHLEAMNRQAVRTALETDDEFEYRYGAKLWNYAYGKNEADRAQLADDVASRLHEQWKADFAKKNGADAQRWKAAKDATWEAAKTQELGLEPGKTIGAIRMTAEGKIEIDIAHMKYDELTSAWQGENKAAGVDGVKVLEMARTRGVSSGELERSLRAAMEQLEKGGKLGEDFNTNSGRSFIMTAGDEIHKAWLTRNGSWAPAEQKLPFSELDANNQKLDLNVLQVTLEAFFAGDNAQLSEVVASKLHEQWKSDFANKNGADASRWKAAKDATWEAAKTQELGLAPGKTVGAVRMTAEGKVEIDIAHMKYDELTSAWQGENKAAGVDGVNVLEMATAQGITIEQLEDALNAANNQLSNGASLDSNFTTTPERTFIMTAGDEIHKSWLTRNGAWAPTEQKLPFSELDANNQKLDLNILQVAIKASEGDRAQLADDLASRLHEQWKSDFARNNGPDAQRWKAAKDSTWEADKVKQLGLEPGKTVGTVRMTAEGKVEIDIAHMRYDQLTSAWQGENKAAGVDGTNVLEMAAAQGISVQQLQSALQAANEQLSNGTTLGSDFTTTPERAFIMTAGDTIHKAWLARNGSWAPAEQKLPFSELDANNQKLDLNIFQVAAELLNNRVQSILSGWADIEKRVNGAVGSGYSISLTPQADNKAIAEIKVPAVIGKEGFVAKGTVNFNDPNVINRFDRIRYDVSNFGEGYGGPEASIRTSLRELGMTFTDRQVTEPAKQRTIENVRSDLQYELPDYNSLQLVEKKGGKATAQEFLDALKTAVEEAQQKAFAKSNEYYAYTDTLNRYRDEDAIKLLAIRFFYNDNGYPMSPSPARLEKKFALMEEFYKMRGDMAMNVVTLRNGSQEAEPLVRVMMLSLRSLFNDLPGILAAYDIREILRNPNYQMSDTSKKKLQSLALMEGNGQVHESIRNVVLSSIVGEGLDMTLVSPLKGKDEAMTTVTLKNGAVEAEPLVRVMMMSLERLINENPIVFYELVMKARDSKHQFFGNTGDTLESLNLVGSDGHMHDSIRNILLSAVEGDGLDMTLSSPVKSKAPGDKAMTTVVLKNGATEAEPLVRVTMISLEGLLNQNPIAFYELTMKARDSKHQFFGNTGDFLKRLALVQADGSIHDSVRNIVLSAVEGGGLDMTLTSPVKSKAPGDKAMNVTLKDGTSVPFHLVQKTLQSLRTLQDLNQVPSSTTEIEASIIRQSIDGGKLVNPLQPGQGTNFDATATNPLIRVGGLDLSGIKIVTTAPSSLRFAIPQEERLQTGIQKRPVVDKASVSSAKHLGGIDFNAANLNLQIKRDGKGVALPITQQNLENIKIDGLVPVIIDIKPIAAAPLLSELQGAGVQEQVKV